MRGTLLAGRPADVAMATWLGRQCRVFRFGCRLCGGGAAAAALGLAALRAVLFLNADEAQAAAVLADDAGALDTLLEAAEELVERLGIFDLNAHAAEPPW